MEPLGHPCWLPCARSGLSWDGVEYSAHRERVLTESGRALAEALAGWREKYPAVPVRQDVVADHPAKVLAC